MAGEIEKMFFQLTPTYAYNSLLREDQQFISFSCRYDPIVGWAVGGLFFKTYTAAWNASRQTTVSSVIQAVRQSELQRTGK